MINYAIATAACGRAGRTLMGLIPILLITKRIVSEVLRQESWEFTLPA
jgi:hypothetical protein